MGKNCGTWVSSERLVGAGIAIYPDSMKHWNAPNNHESISEAERNRILDDVKRAFAYDNVTVYVE
ncbi:MAG: Imm74 family immunity protein [Armatimonadota bacterium]